MQRRQLLGLAARLSGATMLGPLASIALAAQKFSTPSQHRGPFYPRKFPLDKDFDLTRVAGQEGVAFGEIFTVAGQVLNVDGQAVAGVTIEIWQVNGYGRYHHEGDSSDQPLDANFQGYGAVSTDADGRYSFRTVKPVAYPGRAPHIHFALTQKSGPSLVTQMYLAGAKENRNDFLLNDINDKARRDSLVVELEKSASQWLGRFDIVLPAAD